MSVPLNSVLPMEQPVRCGVCKEIVYKSDHKDAHDPKKCKVCHQDRPAGQFPENGGAGDGRANICVACGSTKDANKRAERDSYRKRDNAAQNERLRQYGYRWDYCPHPRDKNYPWRLLDPTGAEVELREAERRISQIEYDQDPGW
jgi:hypothetical protein